MSDNDWSIKLIDGSPKLMGLDPAYEDDSDDTTDQATRNRRHRRSLAGTTLYVDSIDAGVDVLFSTAALPALYSGLPTTVQLLDEDYLPVEEASSDW